MLILDNIVFSLQRTGGISVVWQQHLRRIEADSTWQKRYIEYPNSNIQRSEIALTDVEALRYRRLERYRQPAITVGDGDIFHSSYFRTLKGAKNITTIHDLTYHYYRHGAAKAVHLWEEERALRASDHVICISENTRRDLLTFYPWLREDKVSVVYNGVSDVYCPTDAASIAPYASGEYLLYVGSRNVGYKRFDVAVEVAKQSGQPLVLVGNKISEEEAKRLDETLGREHWFSCTEVGESGLNTLYNHAMALLYPSDYEGFGLPIIEAQRAGCPVLAQQASSVPEVAGEGALLFAHNEIVAAMTEAIRSLKSGQIESSVLREKGFINSQRFSWDKTYKETTDIYKHT